MTDTAPPVFDPKHFRTNLARDEILRNALIAIGILAALAMFLLSQLQWLSSIVAPALIVGMWFWASASTARVAKTLNTLGDDYTTQPQHAEATLRKALQIRPVMRWARLLAYHRLAGLYHLTGRYSECAAACLCVLGQPLKGPAAASRPHLLLMLAECQLELGNLPGAYHALAHLQQTRLGLTESLQRLAIQTRYELAAGAYEAALRRSRAKVELAELMPAAHCATMHAMLATAARYQDQPRLADWLWERTRLLASPQLMTQYEQGSFGLAVVEHDQPPLGPQVGQARA